MDRDAEKVKKFEAQLESLERRHGHFVWLASFGHLVIILGQVQLALRHPGNRGYSATQAREVVDAWIAHLEQEEPGIGEFLAMGFDPDCDVDVGEPT